MNSLAISPRSGELIPVNSAAEFQSEGSQPLFDLNPDQQAAIRLAMQYLDNWRDRAEPFRVSGLAGTGKTVTLIELVRLLREERHMNPAVCAPTGKAAHVISNKQSFFKARTAHSVLTKNPVDHLLMLHERLAFLADQTPTPEVKQEIARLEKLVEKYSKANSLSFSPIDPEDFYDMHFGLVMDESSMVGYNTLFRDFIRPIHTPMFFFGDYGQLPPVQDTSAIDLQNPDYKLTIIQRQALESGIVKLAHSIRGSAYVDPKLFEQFDDLTADIKVKPETILKYCEDHQVLVWKNDTRHKFNPIIRLSRGFNFTEQKHPYLPMVGEELLFDQNLKELGIFKGTPFTVLEVEPEEEYLKDKNLYTVAALVEFPNGQTRKMELNIGDLVPPSENLFDDPKEDRNMRMGAKKQAVSIMFPYALTVHKAQGSEWDKVCVVGEYPPSMKEFQEWFYTAVTRAAKELVVVSDMYFKSKVKNVSLADLRARRNQM